MFRSLFNAIADKLGCTVSSRRSPITTSILLERDCAGKSEKTDPPEWAKTTVMERTTIVEKTTVVEKTMVDDTTQNEGTVPEEKVENKEDTVEEARGKRNSVESRSSMDRSRDSSLNSSRAFHEADQKYGERISDDALVTFCERVKDAIEKNKKDKNQKSFEGWLGINTVLIFARMVAARRELEKAKQKNDKKAIKALESELGGSEETQKEIDKAITGKKRVVQILYDANRLHYVVIHYSPFRKCLYLYDSLLDLDHPKRSLKAISDQIVALFGNRFPADSDIPIRIPLNYEQQNDDWSCGYRAIACLLNIVLSRDPPINMTYNIEAIHTLLIDCLDSPEVSHKEFEQADFYRDVPESEGYEDDLPYYYVPRDYPEKVDDNNNEETKEEK